MLRDALSEARDLIQEEIVSLVSLQPTLDRFRAVLAAADKALRESE